MRTLIEDRCKVWEINDLNGRAEVTFSCSRKVKDDAYDKVQVEHGVAKNGYISTYFRYVKFVGEAYEKLKEINVGDVITKLVSSIEYEPYWSSNEGCILYPKNPKITVFNFKLYDAEAAKNNNYSNNLDSAPQVAEAQKPAETASVNKVQENAMSNAESANSADDECPF